MLDLLPTSPDDGLYTGADIPPEKLLAAVRDYGRDVHPGDVLALYDATRLGSAKDGALFLADRLVFQNNDLQQPRTIRYDDLVGVRQTRSFLGGRAVEMDLNRARATVTETLDLSAHPGAAEYIERFLREAMLSASEPEAAAEADATDTVAVANALAELFRAGRLTAEDRDRLLLALSA